ncbi:MAG: hypothetical protein D6725_06165 [Planctomycetota bacterium]|nr:MAG: hypothetical protein D6725_06165 [Planctomycetota bacterium]
MVLSGAPPACFPKATRRPHNASQAILDVAAGCLLRERVLPAEKFRQNGELQEDRSRAEHRRPAAAERQIEIHKARNTSRLDGTAGTAVDFAARAAVRPSRNVGAIVRSADY